MDVIAGRKTIGTIEGTVLYGGNSLTDVRALGSLMAYCEQRDLHDPFATVEEALEFSGRLRLPKGVDSGQRSGFLEEVCRVRARDVLLAEYRPRRTPFIFS